MTDRCVTLPENATIKHCRSLLSEIQDAMASGGGLEISAEKFAVGDLTTIQILLSAKKSATAGGCRFALTKPTEEFLALLRRAGVESI